MYKQDSCTRDRESFIELSPFSDLSQRGVRLISKLCFYLTVVDLSTILNFIALQIPMTVENETLRSYDGLIYL